MSELTETSEVHQPDKRSRFCGLIIVQAALVAALAVWVLLLRLDLGWGYEWLIRVHAPYRLSRLLPAVVLLLGVGGLAGYLWKLMRREPGARARRALAWAVASAAARQPQSAEGSTAVFNAGRGGHNSRNLLQRLHRDVTRLAPDDPSWKKLLLRRWPSRSELLDSAQDYVSGKHKRRLFRQLVDEIWLGERA